jgi:hypothetical protein
MHTERKDWDTMRIILNSAGMQRHGNKRRQMHKIVHNWRLRHRQRIRQQVVTVPIMQIIAPLATMS